MDNEQMAQEAAIWPWLESDCMADPEPEEGIPLGYEETCLWDGCGWGSTAGL